MEQNNWGIVLCGGGAKGAYQMGALQALEEAEILNHICGISGVSIGAINALIVASNNVKQGVEIWKKINPLTVFDMDFSLIDGYEGTFSREGMRTLIQQYIDFEKIRNCPYPLYVTTTAKQEKQSIVRYYELNAKSNQDIMTLIEATSALPVIYEHVVYDGMFQMDGGIMDNTPIKPLYDQGCRKFIILSLSSTETINPQHFPDAEFYLLRPYKSLGGLISGTLNFTSHEIKTNLKLGYVDGKRFIKAFLEKDTLVANHYDLYAQMDYDYVLKEMQQEHLQESIDANMDYLNKIMEKYDIK